MLAAVPRQGPGLGDGVLGIDDHLAVGSLHSVFLGLGRGAAGVLRCRRIGLLVCALRVLWALSLRHARSSSLDDCAFAGRYRAG